MNEIEAKMIDFIADAERAIVGLVMRDGAKVVPVVEPLLRPSDFRDEDLAELYQVAVDMHAARVEHRLRPGSPVSGGGVPFGDAPGPTGLVLSALRG